MTQTQDLEWRPRSAIVHGESNGKNGRAECNSYL